MTSDNDVTVTSQISSNHIIHAGEIVKEPIRSHLSDQPTHDISRSISHDSPNGGAIKSPDTDINDDRLTSRDGDKHGRHIHRLEDRFRNPHRRHRLRHVVNVDEGDGGGGERKEYDPIVPASSALLSNQNLTSKILYISFDENRNRSSQSKRGGGGGGVV